MEHTIVYTQEFHRFADQLIYLISADVLLEDQIRHFSGIQTLSDFLGHFVFQELIMHERSH